MIHRILTFPCPECGTSLQVPESSAGKRGMCPKCKKTIGIPTRVLPTDDAARKRPTNDTAPTPTERTSAPTPAMGANTGSGPTSTPQSSATGVQVLEAEGNCPPDEARWEYKPVKGPVITLTFKEIVELARNGQLAPSSQIREGAEGPWVQLGQLSCLAFPPITAQRFAATCDYTDHVKLNYVVRRIGALFIDLAILMLVIYASFMTLDWADAKSPQSEVDQRQSLETSRRYVIVIASAVLVWKVTRDWWPNRRSLGKAICGLKIVRYSDGALPSLGALAGRTLWLEVLSLVASPFAGFVTTPPQKSYGINDIALIITTYIIVFVLPTAIEFGKVASGARRIGDRLADTRVVFTRLPTYKPRSVRAVSSPANS